MRSFWELLENERATFVQNYSVVNQISEASLKASAPQLIEVTKLKPHPLGADYKFIKYQYFVFINSIIDVVTAAAAQDLNVALDSDLEKLCSNIKVELVVGSFNDSFLRKMPSFVAMHGQDILLYRAIEEEARNQSGVSFFNYGHLSSNYKALTEQFLKAVGESNGAEKAWQTLSDEFRNAFLKENVVRNDLSFSQINATACDEKDKIFINEFELFMNDLPDFVYHPEHAASRYIGKGFEYNCACGQVHQIDDSEAICDGGAAHFVVYRSLCKKSVVKIISTGLFRVKGIEIAKVLTGREGLINIACEAIASRKRLA